jgi:hypothetical protein
MSRGKDEGIDNVSHQEILVHCRLSRRRQSYLGGDASRTVSVKFQVRLVGDRSLSVVMAEDHSAAPYKKLLSSYQQIKPLIPTE